MDEHKPTPIGIMVARLAKAATVNDTAARALAWLAENPAPVAGK